MPFFWKKTSQFFISNKENDSLVLNISQNLGINLDVLNASIINDHYFTSASNRIKP